MLNWQVMSIGRETKHFTYLTQSLLQNLICPGHYAVTYSSYWLTSSHFSVIDVSDSVVNCAILFKITHLVIVIHRVSSLSTKSFKPFPILMYTQTFTRLCIKYSVRTKTDNNNPPPPHSPFVKHKIYCVIYSSRATWP